MHSEDAIDTVAGLTPGSALFGLRHQRPDVVARAQASDNAVFSPKEDGGLSPGERVGLAVHIAALLRMPDLERHFRMRLAALGGSRALPADRDDDRWRTLLAHVERITLDPSSARREHITALADAGLSPRAVVALSQLIAYVNFEARVLAGLNMLRTQQ